MVLFTSGSTKQAVSSVPAQANVPRPVPQTGKTQTDSLPDVEVEGDAIVTPLPSEECHLNPMTSGNQTFKDDQLRAMMPATMPVGAIPILGKWKCTELSKEYDSFLQDLGFPWIARKPAIMLAKSTLTFYVKSFSAEELKAYDKYLHHQDGNPLLACKYKIGPATVEEPLPGFVQPSFVGAEIKEEITREFDGSTLVTRRDWISLKNGRSAFKVVPTEMRVYVAEGENDCLHEVVTWGQGKRYHRSFTRLEMDLRSCFLTGAPDRPDGKYFVWTEKGITFLIEKIKALNKNNCKDEGLIAGFGVHSSIFVELYNNSRDESNPYDWNRLCEEGMIKLASTTPPDLPKGHKYIIREEFVNYMIDRLKDAGGKKNKRGKWTFCNGPLDIIQGHELKEETWKLAFTLNPSHLASPDDLVALQMVDVRED